MDRCQICGRHPAKRMEFKAHRGFVIFRQEVTIGGVFCRDHALEAYFTARGVTLKGMWFSPHSLLFGALRSVWDSVKLLDLPDEVRDAPWVPHVVACPKCGSKNVFCAGPNSCARCGYLFLVVSCESCAAVHAINNPHHVDLIALDCRHCGRRIKGPGAIRNSGLLVLSRALAELTALIAGQEGEDLGKGDRDILHEFATRLFSLDECSLGYIDWYLYCCLAGESHEVWKTLRENCIPDVLRMLISFGCALVQADGYVDEQRKQRLGRIAIALGFDPNVVLDAEFRSSGQTPQGPWWEVLHVSRDASMDEMVFAYRKLAVQFHPDIWARATQEDRNVAERQMKVVNQAFEEAKKQIVARDKAKTPRNPSPNPRPKQEKPSQAADSRPDKAASSDGRPERPAWAAEAKRVDPGPKPDHTRTQQEASRATHLDADAANAAKHAADIINAAMPLRPDASNPGQDAATANAPDAAHPSHAGRHGQIWAVAIVALVLGAVLGGAFVAVNTARPPEKASQLPLLAPATPPPGEKGTDTPQLPANPPINHRPSTREQARTEKPRSVLPDHAREPVSPPAPRSYPDPILGRSAYPPGDYTPPPERAELLTSDDLHARACERFTRGDLNGAFEDLTAIIERNPESARAFHDRGVVFVNTGRPDEAIHDFNRAVVLYPRFAEAYAHRAIAYQRKGDHRSAARDMATAERLGFRYGQ